jgi:uncharacterized protein (TIRG00374 family)
MNKKRLLLGILLSIVFLYFFLRNLDMGEVWKVLLEGKTSWLILAISTNILNYFVRSLRWRYFLEPLKKVGIWNSYKTTVIGFALSAIFPARIGEVVRPYLLGKKENISRSAALATVVVERVFDTMTVLLMLVFYLFVLIEPSKLSQGARDSLDQIKRTGIFVFAFVAFMLVLLYYLKHNPAAVRKLAKWCERFLPKKIGEKIDGVLESFIEGLSILSDKLLLFKISYWSILFWLVISVSFWATAKAYGVDFPFSGTFLIMILLAIGVAVPTPGGVGSFHFACKFGLTRFFDVPDAQAGAIALVFHATSFIPVTIQGLIFLWHEGLSTKKLSTLAEDEEAEKDVTEKEATTTGGS